MLKGERYSLITSEADDCKRNSTFWFQIKQFQSYAGVFLTSSCPDAADNPLGYKSSWSLRGVLFALLNNASWLENGQLRSVAGYNLMALARSYYISPAFAFVTYPNRDSSLYREWYNIPKADTIVHGTLRYQGFPEFIRAVAQLGWPDAGP